MYKKIKISSLWIWMVVVLLVLFGVISLIQMWIAHQGSLEVSSSTGVLNPESISKEAGFPSQVNIENNPASTADIIQKKVNPEVVAPEAVVIANKPASVQAVPYSLGQSSQSQVTQQEAQQTTVIPINAPMTDQQILEGIRQQNQRQQTIQQITANRYAAAVQVMRNAETAQSKSANSQQVIPSDYPKALPPADIVAKLKSHQLTGH